MRRFFAFFLVSGFCGLVYESVWIRLSMAQFGVTSASLSIVVSIFMAGLALGSWLVARSRGLLERMDAAKALRAYAIAELGIGAFGFFVPPLLKLAGTLSASTLAGKGPIAWYFVALASQSLILLPATAAMGATIPLGMHAIRKARLEVQGGSFSYLYLANVLGSVLGALIPTFILIELFGFHRTLDLVLVLNLGIAAFAWAGAVQLRTGQEAAQTAAPAVAPLERTRGEPALLAMLFLTGLCSLGLEVVWSRQFTVLVGTFVYSFAAILATYLAATFAGSALYRSLRSGGTPLKAWPWALVALLGALPLVATDPSLLWTFHSFDSGGSISAGAIGRLALGIAPFSAALGFLTPQLVDRWSGGDEGKAGIAYAVNTIGCILGPLLAGFLLLPRMSTHAALGLLCAPFLIAAGVFAARAPGAIRGWAATAASLGFVLFGLRATHTREDGMPGARIERDYVATTVAAGQGMGKRLLVNGVGMTVLTPITKMMAHLPLAMLDHPPKRALAICFGMGTTFRSLNTWGIDVTAVELVPGVPKLFPYFHADADAVRSKPGAHVVIDDGRRFLQSDRGQYDLITIDPPPPVQAASSSLLYSIEFYRAAQPRLAEGGILAQWVPGGTGDVISSMVKAMREVFPYIAIYREGMGLHLLASMKPLSTAGPDELARKLSPAAAADFVEFGPRKTPAAEFADVLPALTGADVDAKLAQYPDVPPLSDDRPFNEYGALRTWLRSRR